jgi:hypothetical protein
MFSIVAPDDDKLPFAIKVVDIDNPKTQLAAACARKADAVAEQRAKDK